MHLLRSSKISTANCTETFAIWPKLSEPSQNWNFELFNHPIFSYHVLTTCVTQLGRHLWRNFLMIKFQMLMLWPRSKLETQSPARGWVSIFCLWPCDCDVNPRGASCIKVKMATESGKTTQALPLKGLAGKQWRHAEKLSLFLRGERRMTARCSSRRICRDKEEHSSRGFWIFRRSALWIEPLRCLSKLAIADRPCSSGFFFDEYECAGF